MGVALFPRFELLPPGKCHPRAFDLPAFDTQFQLMSAKVARHVSDSPFAQFFVDNETSHPGPPHIGVHLL